MAAYIKQELILLGAHTEYISEMIYIYKLYMEANTVKEVS